MLIAHQWPGNVRELRNVVERWVALELTEPEQLFDEPPIHALHLDVTLAKSELLRPAASKARM